jgi:hypothetical protein
MIRKQENAQKPVAYVYIAGTIEHFHVIIRKQENVQKPVAYSHIAGTTELLLY